MYAGRVVERGEDAPLFYDPQMPYTWGLLGSIPRLDRPRAGAAALDQGHAAVADQPAGRAASSGRAARTRSSKCTEEPALENRVEEPGHLDRCWLDVE